MPIFDHRCEACGYTLEAFVHNTAPNPPCPKCGGETAHVLLPPAPAPEIRVREFGQSESWLANHRG